VLYHGEDLYGPKVDAAEVRRRKREVRDLLRFGLVVGEER